MEQNLKTRYYADIALLVVAIIWGTTFPASKNALNYVTPLYFMAIRFILAFIIMAVVFHKKVLAMKKDDFVGGLVVGAILFVAFATQTLGLVYTTAGKQAFLSGTYVVMVPFLYWLAYRKKPDMRAVIGAVVCFIGIGLLTLNTGFDIGLGDSLTLFSSALFGAHIIAVGYYVEKHDATMLTVTQFGVAGILALITALIFVPPPTYIAPVGILSIVYLGIFGTCVAYFLQIIAQKYTLSTHASIILSMESVFGSIFSVLILGDVFTLKMILGCIAILAAILIAELKHST